MSPRNDRNRDRNRPQQPPPQPRRKPRDDEHGDVVEDEDARVDDDDDEGGDSKGEPMKSETKGGAQHIQVKDSMHQLLALYKGEKMALLPSAVRSDDPRHFGGGGGADNREAHYCAYWLAMEPTNPVNVERMRLFLEREQRCFCGDEPFMGGATHRQLWYGAMGAALWTSEGWSATEQAYRPVYALAVQWFQAAHQLHRIARTSAPVGDDDKLKRDVLWGIGGRSVIPRGPRKGEATGANSTDAKMWAAITKGKLGGDVNQYDVGAYFVSRCSEATRRAIQQPLRQLPPMIVPLHAARFGDDAESDFYVQFEGLKVLEGVASAGKLDGRLWIARDVDREKLAAYEGRRATITVDTAAA